MIWYQSTPPALEPVTLTEAKTHLRITSSDDDTYITALIVAAREWCETYTGRQFVTATYTATMEAFSDSRIVLPKPPLISVTSVKYYDTANAQQTLSATYYASLTHATPGYVELNYNYSWPSTYTRSDAVEIIYTAGYGATAASVPDCVKHAMKILVSHMYEMREPIVIGASINDVPLSIKSLLNTVKVIDIR